jgi:hypothetical protein
VDKYLFGLALFLVALLLWSLLQGALLRGAGAILNGVSAKGGPEVVPDLGLWKSTGVAALAVVVNVLVTWAVFYLMVRDPYGLGLNAAFGYWLLAQAAALPLSVVVVAALSLLLLPAPFGRAAMVALIWSVLFLLAGLCFYLLLQLLFSATGPMMKTPGRVEGAPPYSPVELGIFAAVALLLEVPVFYASTALAGSEPSVLKTFVVPMVSAAIWGVGAVAAVYYLTPAWLTAPEHRYSLVGLISLIVLASLIVQAVLFKLLIPTSIFGGVLTSVFQLLLRLLLYVLLMALGFVFLSIVQVLRQEAEQRGTTVLAPVVDALFA